jgi:hypothetical protein
MHKVIHRSRQSKSTRRVEEIELATVYLELNSRVQPTWGQSVEPDAYITDLEGGILVAREAADGELRVGTVSAHSVHLGEPMRTESHGSMSWTRAAQIQLCIQP